MTEDEINSLKTKLAQPHRVQNSRVLFAACKQALAYIEALEAKPKRGRPPKAEVTDPVLD
jgi:hypothetical protein